MTRRTIGGDVAIETRCLRDQGTSGKTVIQRDISNESQNRIQTVAKQANGE